MDSLWRGRLTVLHMRPIDHAIAIEKNCRSSRFPARGGFPLGWLLFHAWMRYQQMPHHRLERLGVRRDVCRVDGRNEDADIRDLGGEAAVASDDAKNFRAGLADRKSVV